MDNEAQSDAGSESPQDVREDTTPDAEDGQENPQRRTLAHLNAREKGEAFTDEHIEQGLRTMALCSGHGHQAARVLNDQGWGIDARALYRWANELHQDRYARIKREAQPEIQERLAEQTEGIARRLGELEEKVADQLEAEIPNMKGDRAAGALRNVTVAKAVNLDKSRLLRDKPTEIRGQEPSVPEILSSLAKFGVIDVENSPLYKAHQEAGTLDSTAEEIDP